MSTGFYVDRTLPLLNPSRVQEGMPRSLSISRIAPNLAFLIPYNSPVPQLESPRMIFRCTFNAFS